MIRLFYSFIFVSIFCVNVAFSDTSRLPGEAEDFYEQKIVETSYLLSKDNHIFAKSRLTNGCEIFLFPAFGSDDEEKAVEVFKKNFYEGARVVVKGLPNKVFLEAWTEHSSCRAVMYSDSMDLLPTFVESKIFSPSWFSVKIHVILSDGSVWNCDSYSVVGHWKNGDRVLISKGVGKEKDKYYLLNVDAEYMYLDFYYEKFLDKRTVMVDFDHLIQ